MAFVFLNESEFTIDEGYFAILVNEDTWQNFPAYRHGSSASLSVADGHSELKKWMEPNFQSLSETRRAIQVSSIIGPQPGVWCFRSF